VGRNGGALSWSIGVPRLLPTGLLCALALAGCSLSDKGSDRPPQLGAKASDEQAATKLGFPSAATTNTIRVGGGDSAATAAGVVNAVFPATDDRNRPAAVALVDKDDWQGAVAASVLMARPTAIPMLLSDGGDLPPVSDDTLKRLKPKGSDLSKDAQVIRIGDKPPAPAGRKVAVIRGKDEYQRAAAIDRFFTAAKGGPSSHVVVASGERAEYAMPAAAWAARSGDSVLLVKKGSIPSPTAKALRAHERPDMFVLGPESVIGKGVERDLRKLGRVRRIAGPTPVQNAIAFARFEARGFGWGVLVPGHNFSLASAERPLDAAAAAALGAKGVFAPLLLTDDAKRLPRSLESYLLDLQPGFEGDPGEGVYNRVWILGDDKAVSVQAQGRLDEITELIPVELNRP
jgi:putative cell wall binding repeat protein